ncbi:MAG: 50S ribosomal protein L11 methyltransferase [Anaerolineaceae bacterium]|nr:50S ribosomal protein L11 methyltransferase [Anaerolineaceae bacterium]
MVDFSGYFKSYLDYLPILLIVISLYWTRIVGGPWVPSSMQVVYRMLDMAGVKPNDTVYDLGCGDGRVLVAAAKRYHARAVGIEIDPIRYLWCQILISLLGLRKQVQIIFGNLFNADLSEADVVVCYLMPDALSKLETKLKTELEPGKRIVSNKFSFPTLEMVRKDGNAILYTTTPNQSEINSL